MRTGDVGSSRVFVDRSKSSGPFAGHQEVAGAGIDVRTYSIVQAMTATTSPRLHRGGRGHDAARRGGAVHVRGRPQIVRPGRARPTRASPNRMATRPTWSRPRCATGKPTALVLIGGSVITMPSFSQLKAVVMAWYPGMDGGGRWASCCSATPTSAGSSPSPGPRTRRTFLLSRRTQVGNADMDYYLGYRFWDKRLADDPSAPKPQFVFGHGLSYTTFSYKNLHCPARPSTRPARSTSLST